METTTSRNRKPESSLWRVVCYFSPRYAHPSFALDSTSPHLNPKITLNQLPMSHKCGLCRSRCLDSLPGKHRTLLLHARHDSHSDGTSELSRNTSPPTGLTILPKRGEFSIVPGSLPTVSPEIPDEGNNRACGHSLWYEIERRNGQQNLKLMFGKNSVDPMKSGR